MTADIVIDKVCPSCLETKPRHEYQQDASARDGLHSHCKRCRATRRDKNRSRQYLLERFGSIRSFHLWGKYRITPEKFNELLEAQHHKCAICATTTPGGRHGQFMVDHCHKSGQVRGLLCYRCNSALGQLGDSEQGILRALAYLRGEVIDVKEPSKELRPPCRRCGQWPCTCVKS